MPKFCRWSEKKHSKISSLTSKPTKLTNKTRRLVLRKIQHLQYQLTHSNFLERGVNACDPIEFPDLSGAHHSLNDPDMLGSEIEYEMNSKSKLLKKKKDNKEKERYSNNSILKQDDMIEEAAPPAIQNLAGKLEFPDFSGDHYPLNYPDLLVSKVEHELHSKSKKLEKKDNKEKKRYSNNCLKEIFQHWIQLIIISELISPTNQLDLWRSENGDISIFTYIFIGSIILLILMLFTLVLECIMWCTDNKTFQDIEMHGIKNEDIYDDEECDEKCLLWEERTEKLKGGAKSKVKIYISEKKEINLVLNCLRGSNMFSSFSEHKKCPINSELFVYLDRQYIKLIPQRGGKL